MNKILPEMELGKLRKSDEALIDSETNEVVAEMVELQYIEGELKKLFDWIAKESQNVHPLLKADLKFYEINRIYPFSDGNGRTSRIVTTHSLYSGGYNIKRFFSARRILRSEFEQILQGSRKW